MLAKGVAVRWCCAAAHVVVHDNYAGVAHSAARPGGTAELAAHIDWAGTARVRTRLADAGMTIAEAMDTAQRQYLGWPLAKELIARTAAQNLQHGFVAGAGAEQVGDSVQVARIVDAVVEQGRWIRAHGGEVALLPLTTLALAQASEATYCEVFGAIARELGAPLILHRLGAVFQPQLRHDFPGDSFQRILKDHADSIRAVKWSLLDPEAEVALRRELLPREQFVLTGDDWNFPALMCGTAQQVGAITGFTHFGARRVALGDFSHALLGVLDVIAAPLSSALHCLQTSDAVGWMARMAPLEALSRKLFEPPVGDYKAGIAYLSCLNGWQSNPMLLNHQELQRDDAHYAALRALAAAARVT